MASHLIEDQRFMIYAPVIMNSDVLIYHTDIDRISRLGISQGRKHIAKMVSENYPQITEIWEISPRILNYALADGQIDAAVTDITKAVLVPDVTIAPISEEDYISYVLVVRKDVVDTKPFGKFIQAYNKTVRELKESNWFSEDMNAQGSPLEAIHIKFLEI